jgi:hypothetical protein
MRECLMTLSRRFALLSLCLAVLLAGCGETLTKKRMLTRRTMAALYPVGFDQVSWNVGWRLLRGEEVTTADVVAKIGEPDFRFSASDPAALRETAAEAWFTADPKTVGRADLASVRIWFWHPAIRAQNPDWADWSKVHRGQLGDIAVPPPSLTLLVVGDHVVDYTRGVLAAPVPEGVLKEAMARGPITGRITGKMARGGKLALRIYGRVAGTDNLLSKRAVIRFKIGAIRRGAAALRDDKEQEVEVPDWKAIPGDSSPRFDLTLTPTAELIEAAKGGHLIVTGTLYLYEDDSGDKLLGGKPIVLLPTAIPSR